MRIVVIIPTYNEAENVDRLIPILEEEFKKMPQHEFLVLVVDGNSPDGTGDVVLRHAGNYSNVQLLLEKKKAGLGAAYTYAFKHAMDEMEADVVIGMDGDFQHDPKHVTQFIEKIDEGYDFVIGSRYTKGGSIPEEWAFYRKVLSFGGNLFSRIVLWMPGVNDFTSGYSAFRVKGFLDQIDFDTMLSTGFAYKLDLLYRLHKLGAKIVEIPIEFGLRGGGDSKMERSNTVDSLTVVLKIRYRESQSFVRFVIVGFAGLFTDLFLSNVFRLGPFAPNVAASLAALLAMLVTYTLNNFWSFDDRSVRGFKNLAVRYVPYVLISLVPIAFRYIIVGYIVDKYGDTFIYYNLALFAAISFGLVWNYIFYSRVIWKKKV